MSRVKPEMYSAESALPRHSCGAKVFNEAMESPRVINRTAIAVFAATTLLALVGSIQSADFSILFGWLAVLVLFLAVCVVGALLNMAIFIPVFHLMAKVDYKLKRTRQRGPDRSAG